jgi:hypothetical protein
MRVTSSPAATSLEAKVQGPAAAPAPSRSQLEGHWTYVPDAVLAPAVKGKRKFVALDFDDNAEEEVAEDPSLAINEADEAAAIADPFNGERSCGISSLVEQALAIFPRWDSCGYMMANKVCACVCACVRLCVCVCIRRYIYTHTFAYIHTHIHVYISILS